MYAKIIEKNPQSLIYQKLFSLSYEIEPIDDFINLSLKNKIFESNFELITSGIESLLQV